MSGVFNNKVEIPHDERHDVYLFDYSPNDDNDTPHGTGRHYAKRNETTNRHVGINLLLGDTDSLSKKQKMLHLFQEAGPGYRLVFLAFTPVFLLMVLLGPYIPGKGFIYASQRMQSMATFIGGLALLIFLILCKINHDSEKARKEAQEAYRLRLEEEHKERKKKCGW